jgi:glucose-6-phosphate dehydrogenase assembly protein OpcA
VTTPAAPAGPAAPAVQGATLNEPVLRWSARAHSIAEVEQELGRIWARQDLTTEIEGEPARYIAARTSVMNLVVVARRPELAERGAATIQALTGRHPSRTIVVQSADPDGPSWLEARVEAHCILPREDAPETCAETIHLTAGGEAGRHLAAIVTPLIIHDLPVTVWWPGEPPFGSRSAYDLLSGADRLVVDGSSWNGDGLERMREMAGLLGATRLSISDFALIRQSRWREAIASIFDDPDFMPYLRSLRRVAVTYATHDETGAPGSTNIVKPIYHVAWLASRLGLTVIKPLSAVAERPAGSTRSRPAPGTRPSVGRGVAATLSDGRSEVAVVVRPVVSTMPAGTTLRVELLAERRGSELRADVTAEAETVHVRVWQDGVEVLDRRFLAARRGDVDLLAEAIETGRRDDIAAGTLRAAAELAGGAIEPSGLRPKA